ncbi:threonine transporter [Kribbella turkmenica]|uniref:Threonine transporter n=1 Tax=Kribbella turkmenica TaxID=2530375 RepID=A0A4R4XFB8_9ACTN|nr:ABC-three component system middle component 2 [Kribbella turkmenica]TDD29239.1 threonine transporter [Kribbella turkmenica]
MQILNSPIEVGVRSLVVLNTIYPQALDLTRLTLMDYCLVHSSDLGGPDSVFPEVPSRSGEFGVKRSVLSLGLQLMMRADMVDMLTTDEGLVYRAGEEAAPFLQLLRSDHVASLVRVAEWVVDEFGHLSQDQIRERMTETTSRWQWEIESPLDPFDSAPAGEGR